jgi:hypothetical protein
VDANYSDCAVAGAKRVCPDAVRAVEEVPEGTDVIGIITRHAFLEEAIIRRIADAIANGGDREKVYALAVELVATQNE